MALRNDVVWMCSGVVSYQLRAAGLGRVPVVLTTGSNEGREEAERLGVRSMEKPFDVNRLLELVRSLVADP